MARNTGEIAVYPFTLDFGAFQGRAAVFPFLYEGKALGAPDSGAPGSRVPAPLCLISSRAAGDMKFDPSVRMNGSVHGPLREAFFASLGIQSERVYGLAQIHSRDVFIINDLRQGPEAFARKGDGIISFCRGAFPSVTVADCLPVFLLDTEKGALAVLHSGWKGTGIALRALEIMARTGTRPEAVAAVLGPCIQSCCYAVDESRAAFFENEFGEASCLVPPGTPYPLGPLAPHRDGGVSLSLQAANARLLAGAGVRNIAYCTDCTYTGGTLGSFRREGPASYTRMIALAGWLRGG